MRKNSRFFLILAALALLLGGGYFLYDTLSQPPDLAPPRLENAAVDTPDFEATDMDGNPVQLSYFFGTPTILYFWTSWCRFCTMGMVELQLLAAEHGDDVQIIAVNLPHLGTMRGEEAAGRAFMAENGLTFPALFDTQAEAQRAYDVTAVPMTVYLNSDGSIARRHLGFQTLEEKNEMVRGLQ